MPKSPNCAICGWRRSRDRCGDGAGDGHVMLREFHLDNPRQYFTDYVRRYTDMPMLVMLEERDGYYAAGRMLRCRSR